MADTLWGTVPTDVTHFSIQKRSGSHATGSLRWTTIDVAQPNGDASAWSPLEQLTRDLLLNVTGGGKLRLAWEIRDGDAPRAGAGTSPVFTLAAPAAPRAAIDDDEPAPRAAPVIPTPGFAPEPQSPFQMMMLLEGMVSARHEQSIRAMRADAEARVAAANANAQAQVAMQTQFFVQVEKMRGQTEGGGALAETLRAITAELASIRKRLDEDEEPDEDEEDVSLRAVMDLYDTKTGEIDWKGAAVKLGPKAVEQAKGLYDLIQAAAKEKAKEAAAKPAAAAT